MKRIVLLGCLLFTCYFFSISQNVFDPQDPIVRYDKNKPVGSAQHPDTSLYGLQKFVSVPVNGVSYGTDAYDASSFKQYFINFNGAKMAFRLKFPRSYSNPDSADKKYPINLFLHGGGEVGCPSNGGIFNNERPIWLGGKMFMQWVDNNQFDGYLLYPQLVVTEGCFAGWGSAPFNSYQAIFAMIDSMEKYVRADIDRVVVDGLSGGGYGAWRMAEAYPKRIAKIIPSAASGVVNNRAAFVHIPIWFATGGLDIDPSPAQAQAQLQKMKDLGADIRYTVYPDRGHAMWTQHWKEPDYVAAMNDIHKANPLVYFQRNEFCRPEDVNAKLGITSGFFAYEWQKDNETIATSTNGLNIILDPAAIISYEGNDITVRSFGTYRVRFKRTAGSNWSVWSPKPAFIKTKSTTQTLPITVNGARSKVLPALDTSSSAPLILAAGFNTYEWYRVSDDQLVSTAQTYDAPVGEYKARYKEQYGCGTEFSPVFKVVDANGSPKPDAASNLNAVPLTENVVKVTWTQGNNETGFEVYRSTQAGGPYRFKALRPANATTYQDSSLAINTLYYYVVRAVNETGAAAASNETTVRTLVDNVPPTAPYNLQYGQGSGPTVVRLIWSASSDNGGIDRYDIYVNGKKLYSTGDVIFTVTGLDSLIPYTFVVRAVDKAGNVSAPSNQTTYLPPNAIRGPVPGMPATFTATAIAYNKIVLSWSDTTNNESGFEIVRATAATATYIPVATVAPNTTAFTDSGVAASKTYYYKIKAINGNGESAFAPTVNATTPAGPVTPLAPTQLTGEATVNNSISLSWTDNSSNETNFKVYRSGDNNNFTLVATLPANSNAYTDNNVNGLTNYYYYVIGTNTSGAGESSNTVSVVAGNNAPVIQSLADILVKAGSTGVDDFTVTDDAGDVVTLSIPDKPSFVTLSSLGEGNYRISASPSSDNVGMYDVTIVATDNNNKSSSKLIRITVGEKNTRSVYINFGNNGYTAIAPWNNWLGTHATGDAINNLKDGNNVSTGFGITTVDAWAATTVLGHITGNNSGVFADAVLQSGITDSAEIKQIKIRGLSADRQYNLVFAGSQNEGISVKAEYAFGGQHAVLDARYNTNQTANLNNIIPGANGEILVTITKTAGSPVMYLNGMVIEEYDPAVQMLSPDNLYADASGRNSVHLTWSDRTNKEDGYELTRAADSLFTMNTVIIDLPGSSNEYTNTGLSPNTKYWYRVRAKSGAEYSEYSKRTKVITPSAIVYVNFNTTVADAVTPWNNLTTPPLSAFTTDLLKDQSGVTTTMALSLEKEFNGEFTSGMNTGSNAGVVPDNVLMSDFWLDKNQLSQFRVSGLNHSKRYRFGFIGSCGPANWFRGNYTATYTINNRTVYLNSWANTSKIVYIGDVAPDAAGKVLLNFSTTSSAGYGFNAGLIIEEYTELPEQGTDTVPAHPPVDTIPDNPPPVDTIPDNPPPVDTIPDTPPSVDTIPDTPPPVDTIPDTPPPVDTIPENPPPVDTIPHNPPIVDTIPDTPPPVDTIPENPPTVDTIPAPIPVTDTVPDIEDPLNKTRLYPNPFVNHITLDFYNGSATDKIAVELYDPEGRICFRRNYGMQPRGNTRLSIDAFETNMRTGMYFLCLRINEKRVKTFKLIKALYK